MNESARLKRRIRQTFARTGIPFSCQTRHFPTASFVILHGSYCKGRLRHYFKPLTETFRASNSKHLFGRQLKHREKGTMLTFAALVVLISGNKSNFTPFAVVAIKYLPHHGILPSLPTKPNLRQTSTWSLQDNQSLQTWNSAG